jgi:SAM-dependent methyltransferase
MDAEGRSYLTELYRVSLARYGANARGMRWASEAGQQERFRLIHEIGPWERRSVADVGSGCGDFLGYLRAAGWRGRRYRGFDIVPEMVEAARRKHPRGRFEVRDAVTEGLDGTYDYVVASGTFNLLVGGHDAFFRRAVAAMYDACRVAVAFNVLEPVPGLDERVANAFGERYFSVPPAELLTVCHGVCARVTLTRSPRLKHETTVYLRRPA